ncbi:hypothetical protein U9M48_023226, partial [Paspalum notatum var. saurae]
MQLWLCCVPWMDGHHALLLFLPPRPSSPPSRPALTSMARRLLLAPAPAWCRKSRRTGLRQRGQRGSASDSMTYMRQRGQAASTMDVASGLSDHCSPWPWWCWSRSPSDDRHELGDDDHSSSDDTADAPLVSAGGAGGDRCSFRSRPLPLPPVLPGRLITPCYLLLSFLSAKLSAGVLCSAEELRTSGGALLVLCSCWVWGKKKRWQQVFIGGKWAVEAMDGGQLVFLIAAALLRKARQGNGHRHPFACLELPSSVGGGRGDGVGKWQTRRARFRAGARRPRWRWKNDLTKKVTGMRGTQ